MDLNERTIDSKEIYSGRVVHLRLDTVRMPNGVVAQREVIVHRGATCMVPMLDDNTVVMVRQYRQAAGEALLEVPAGTLDEGEDPADCAARELQEEIGYKPGKLTPMFKSYLAPGYSSEMLHTYLAEDLARSSADSDEDELIEVVEVPLEAAVGYISSGEIKDAKSICGILMAQRIISQRNK